MLTKVLRKGKNRVKKLTKRDISLNRLANFRKEITTDNHKVPLNILCERLNTNIITGLTNEQAKLVLERTGPNTLTPSTKKSFMSRFFKTLTHSFSVLLWIGAFLSYTAAIVQYYYTREIDVDNFVLGSVLIAVVLVSGGFMFFQESKSSKILETFVNMVPPKATVIRGGQYLLIDSKDVVVGDLVELKSGDRVPADIRIIHCQGLKVDNSSLTGENEPLSRTTQCTNDNIFETKNLAFFSTNALEGTAKGIVVACGDQTVMGRIAGLTARLEKSETPLSKEMRYFMKVIGVWACFLGIVFGGSALSMNYSWLESAMFLIGIIVANVPEGLLATVTVSLTLTAKKMAARNCIVKNLEAVETLGSTSMICSDKTGTLTQNVMTVHHVWFGKTIARAMAPRNKLNSDYLALMRCAVLCNRAKFESNQEEVPIQIRKVIGDASEAAILKYTEKVLPFGPSDEYKRKNVKLAEMPFNSTNKYQISIHALQDGSCLAVMKGAPEKILDKCTLILVNGVTQEITSALFQMCNRACTELAGQGERVLGFCDLSLEERYTVTYPFSIEPPNFPMDKFRFLGFMSLIDPPRPQIVSAISECRAAGIRVFMVTGDHPITARAIAEQVGIITMQNVIDPADYTEKTPLLRNKAIVIQGNTLKEMSSKDLERILCYYKEIVFARTSPTQKLHIVEAAQRIGEIVAVTGDGVNDAPALKKADIGISMGIAGSEVSKQSADIILLDDNFASILLGIEEGRKIFDNLKKSIAYVLASNVAEMMPLLAFIVLGIPLPISVVAILCIDLLTDMLPAISLAYEKAESDIMSRPPRDPNRDRLVSFKLYFYAFGHTGIIEATAGMFVYFMVMAEHGFYPDRLIGLRSEWESFEINNLKDSVGQEWTYQERKVLEYTCSTAFLISVVVTQWSDALVCKTRRNSLFKQGMSNNVLNVSLLIETALACFLSYTPGMDWMKFYPVLGRWWLYSLPFAIFMVIFDEFRKWHIRQYPKGFYKRETYY